MTDTRSKFGYTFFGKVYEEEDIEAMNKMEVDILINQLGTDIEGGEARLAHYTDKGLETHKVEAFLRISKAFLARLKIRRSQFTSEPLDATINVLGENLTIRFLKAFYISAESFMSIGDFEDLCAEARVMEGELK